MAPSLNQCEQIMKNKTVDPWSASYHQNETQNQRPPVFFPEDYLYGKFK